ncbi:MAG TPA: YfiR family protein [Longimicrobiales bacterium]
MFATRALILASALAAAALALPSAARAQLPAQAEVQILMRVLAYDRALDRNGGGDVVVAVLFDAGNAASSRARGDLVRELHSPNLQTILGRGVKVMEVNVAAGGLGDALRAAHASAAYLTPGLEGRLSGVLAATESARVTTVGGSESYARRGVAVGVSAESGRPQLFVNLASARAAGADLPSSLLRLTTVIQ